MRKILQFALLISLAAPAFATTALISHTASANGTTSAISGAGGNFIAVCLNGSTSGWPPGGVPSDSSGNTYTLLKEIDNHSNPGVRLFGAFNPTVTSSMTFTSTGDYIGPAPIAVMIYSGVASGPDQTNGSPTSLSTGNITPTNANELIISCFSNQNGAAASAVTSLTLLDSVYGGSSWTNMGEASAYAIQTTKTTVGATWTASLNGGAALIASFYSNETPGTLTISNSNLPEGFVGTSYTSTGSPYSNQLTATGGVLPYTWSCPSICNLPAGLSISSSTGLITGTPTSAVSAASVTFKVTDSASTSTTVTLPMTVAATPLSISAGTCTGSALNGTQYAAYGGCTVSATGGTSPRVITVISATGYYANSLPEGLTLNSSTGAVSGTVYGQGNYEPNIVVTDGLGSYASVSPVWEIAGKNMNSGCLPMAGSIFNTRLDSLPVDTSVAAPLWSGYASTGLGTDGGNAQDAGGIPFLIVPYNQATEPVVQLTPNSHGQGDYFVQSTFPPYSISSPSPLNQDYSITSITLTGTIAEITTSAGSFVPGTVISFYNLNAGDATNGMNANNIETFTVLSSGQSSTTFNVTFSGAAGIYPQLSSYAAAMTVYPMTAPVPFYAPIEDTANGAGQDQHVIIIQQAGGGNPCREFDQWQASNNGSWWLNVATLNLPNIGTTGANALQMNFQNNGQTDAAGLPVAPLLANAEEVIGTGTPTAPNGAIQHPIRFTAGAYVKCNVWPAAGAPGTCSYYCSGGYSNPNNNLIMQPNTGPNQPPTSCTSTEPFGEIYRLKASVYSSLPSCFATSPQARIIATGLAQYGMILADVGTGWKIVLTNDSQWNNSDLACLNQLVGANFEPVNVMSLVKDLDGSSLPTLTYAVTGGASPTAGVQTSGNAIFSGGVVLQ
jgi:hypothetical protein